MINENAKKFVAKWLAERTAQKHYQYSNEKNIKYNNVETLAKIANTVFSVCDQHKIQVKQCTYLKQYLEPSISFSEGSPNINFSIISRGGAYQTQGLRYNPLYNIWKDVDANESTIQKINQQKNKKWIGEYQEIKTNYDFPYGLFLLQAASKWHKKQTIDALNFAKQTKTYILFKEHPVTPGSVCSDELFGSSKYLKNYVSEYSIVAKYNENLDHLVKNSNFVFSVDSAVSFNAILHNKKCVTYKQTNLSEIVPVISTAQEILDLDKANIEDNKKFLTWYADYLCIDTNDVLFDQKIETRIKQIHNQKPLHKIFSP